MTEITELTKSFTGNINGSLAENDQIKVVWNIEFKEPKPLTPVEQVLKIFNDTIDYWKGYHIGNYNDEHSGWD